MTEITLLTQLGDPAAAMVCADGVCVVPQPDQASGDQSGSDE